MTPLALWFARHEPTDGQISEARRLGYIITSRHQGMYFGRALLLDRAEVCGVIEDLRRDVVLYGARAIFGAFPTPILAAMHASSAHPDTIPVFASWAVPCMNGYEAAIYYHHEWQQVAEFATSAAFQPDAPPTSL